MEEEVDMYTFLNLYCCFSWWGQGNNLYTYITSSDGRLKHHHFQESVQHCGFVYLIGNCPGLQNIQNDFKNDGILGKLKQNPKFQKRRRFCDVSTLKRRSIDLWILVAGRVWVRWAKKLWHQHFFDKASIRQQTPGELVLIETTSEQNGCLLMQLMQPASAGVGSQVMCFPSSRDI